MFLRVDALKKIWSSANIEGIALDRHKENINFWFIYNACAMEGNSYSLMDVMILLKDRITIGGKSIREHNEVINSQKALEFINKALHYKMDLDEHRLKDIHTIVTQNICEGGFYRNCEVRIIGRENVPPSPEETLSQMKELFKDYKAKKDEMHPIELACYMYAEIERIHPFLEENGVVATMVLNYILLKNGYKLLVMKYDEKENINKALDEYVKSKELKTLVNIVTECEEEELKFYLQLGDKNYVNSIAS